MKLSLRKSITTVVLGAFASLCGTAMAADAAAGKAVYTKCKTCHGANGEGNPAMAKVFKVEIKPLASAEVQGMSDADIKKIVTDGKGKMKPVAVSGADLDNVVAFVKTLK